MAVSGQRSKSFQREFSVTDAERLVMRGNIPSRFTKGIRALGRLPRVESDDFLRGEDGSMVGNGCI